MQFEDEGRAKKWFERLTRGYYRWKQNSKSADKDNLHTQVQRWRALWEYVLCRYMELRGEEWKQIKKEGRRPGRIALDMLLDYIFWEYSHENAHGDVAGQRAGVTEKKAGNTREEEDACEKGQAEREAMRDRCCGEMNIIIKRFLAAREKMREISPEGEILRLKGKAFYDLEVMVEYMTMGWLEAEPGKNFTKSIVKNTLDLRRVQPGIDD